MKPQSAACSICAIPVKLEECKTDEEGRAVHEQCYVTKLTGEGNSSQAKPDRRVFAKSWRFLKAVMQFPRPVSSIRGHGHESRRT